MRTLDLIRFSFNTLLRHRLRTFLVAFSVAIGVTSVCLLTALGEGARRYVVTEFSSLGSHLLIVMSGRTETTGGMPPIYGTTPRDLTVEDSSRLHRVAGIKNIAPVIAGTSLIENSSSSISRSREVIVLGSTPAIFPIRGLTLGQGRQLPAMANTKATPLAVLGSKLKHELFGSQAAVGQWIRVDGRKFRVEGVLAERGQSLGLDLRDMVIIPVQSASQLFNTQALFRILIELDQYASEDKIKLDIIKLISEHHQGHNDITILSQDSILSSLNEVLSLLTVSVGMISAISLLVAGVLIMNISLITVSQHREEIGLLKALGASSNTIMALFVSQALWVAAMGAMFGVFLAYFILYVAGLLFPDFPIQAPIWAAPAAVSVAMSCGLIFSWWPSKQAALLAPVIALRG